MGVTCNRHSSREWWCSGVSRLSCWRLDAECPGSAVSLLSCEELLGCANTKESRQSPSSRWECHSSRTLFRGACRLLRTSFWVSFCLLRHWPKGENTHTHKPQQTELNLDPRELFKHTDPLRTPLQDAEGFHNGSFENKMAAWAWLFGMSLRSSWTQQLRVTDGCPSGAPPPAPLEGKCTRTHTLAHMHTRHALAH